MVACIIRLEIITMRFSRFSRNKLKMQGILNFRGAIVANLFITGT